MIYNLLKPGLPNLYRVISVSPDERLIKIIFIDDTGKRQADFKLEHDSKLWEWKYVSDDIIDK